MFEEASKRPNLKEKLGSLGKGFDVDRKTVIVGLTCFSLIVVLASIYSFEPGSIVEDGQDGPQIEGEIVEVVVSDERVSPHRPTISEEDGVRFVNQASHDLNFTFDRDVESFVVEEGESKTVDVNSIVYYYVNPVEDAEFREIKGGVNVQ